MRGVEAVDKYTVRFHNATPDVTLEGRLYAFGSQIASKRLQHPNEILKEGQEVKVKLLGFDDRGKVRLGMKMVDQETGAEIAERKEETAE